MFDVPSIKDRQILPQYALSKQKFGEYLNARCESQETMLLSALRDPRVKQNVKIAVSEFSDISPSDKLSLTDLKNDPRQELMKLQVMQVMKNCRLIRSYFAQKIIKNL